MCDQLTAVIWMVVKVKVKVKEFGGGSGSTDQSVVMSLRNT